MIRRPPRSTQSRSSAASDVYKRQVLGAARGFRWSFWILRFVVMPMMMSEHMHQRTREEKKVGQCVHNVPSMRPQQVGAKGGERERNGPSELGAKEGVAPFGGHVRNSMSARRRIDHCLG